MAFSNSSGRGEWASRPESLGDLEPAIERRIIRTRRRSLGEGSLVCPACELPVYLAGPLAIDADINCGYCDHRAALAGFIRPGARDVPGNRVRLSALI